MRAEIKFALIFILLWHERHVPLALAYLLRMERGARRTVSLLQFQISLYKAPRYTLPAFHQETSQCQGTKQPKRL